MKKIVLFLFLASAMTASLQAQDTLHVHDMRLISKYFVPQWPNEFEEIIDKGDTLIHGFLDQVGENLEQSKEIAYKMYTGDTLQVYGIAASLSTRWRLYPDHYTTQIDSGWLDTSCEYMYDYLRLYEADPDTLRHIGEELLVHLNRTPVSYYIDLGLFSGFEGNADNYTRIYHPILPMYERYFSTPVTVADSFYVGRRYRPDHHGQDVMLLELNDTNMVRNYQAMYLDYVWHDVYGNDHLHKGWDYFYTFDGKPFLFPILALPDTTMPPADIILADTVVVYPGNSLVLAPGSTLILQGDTLVYTGDTLVVHLGDTVDIAGHPFVLTPGDTLVVNPGDTLFVNPDGSIVLSSGGTVVVLSGGGDDPGVAVQQADLVYRYTAVAPNPATGKVKVTSSFGISSLEAYDLKGRKVHEFRAEGCEHLETSRYCSESIPNSEFSINLDVSSWPRGTYLLRIQTPAGPTTKKLLVQ